VKLLKTSRFGPLFATQFLGAFNDNFFKNALVLFIAFQSERSFFGLSSAQTVSVAAGVFILPFFLFSSLAGKLADRQDKARIIVWTKIWELLLMLLAFLGWMILSPSLLIATLFLLGCQATFFGPVKYSILPEHLAPSELLEGNALVEAGTFLAILLGTIIGGIAISVSNGTFWVACLGVVFAVLGWLTSLKVPPAPPTRQTDTAEFRVFEADRIVLVSILAISWFWFFGAALLTLFPSYTKDVLGGDEKVVTLLLSLFSIGIGLGGIACNKISKGKLQLWPVLVGALGMTLCSLDLSFAVPEAHPQIWGALDFLSSQKGFRICADLAALSFCGGVFTVPLYTLIQVRVQARHRSRAVAANNILNALFMVGASVLLFALDARGISIPETFLILAVLNFLVGLFLLKMFGKELRPAE
jgi:MFS family permease